MFRFESACRLNLQTSKDMLQDKGKDLRHPQELSSWGDANILEIAQVLHFICELLDSSCPLVHVKHSVSHASWAHPALASPMILSQDILTFSHRLGVKATSNPVVPGGPPNGHPLEHRGLAMARQVTTTAEPPRHWLGASAFSDGNSCIHGIICWGWQRRMMVMMDDYRRWQGRWLSWMIRMIEI